MHTGDSTRSITLELEDIMPALLAIVTNLNPADTDDLRNKIAALDETAKQAARNAICDAILNAITVGRPI